MTSANNGFTPPQPVTNALAPADGPKALPLRLDFTASTSYTFDCTILTQQGYMSNVQALFVDNSASASPLTIAVQNGMTIIIPPNSQGFIPIACPQPTVLNFASIGNVLVGIILFNVPMPSSVWSVNATSFPVTGGKVQVQDSILEGAIVSGMMQSQLIGLAGTIATAVQTDTSGRIQVQASKPVTLTSHSLLTAATPASTQLMAANANRQYIYIKAPETADLWINPHGGAASVDGTDCVKIAQGTSYESHQCAWSELINYYCATGGVRVTAFEA